MEIVEDILEDIMTVAKVRITTSHQVGTRFHLEKQLRPVGKKPTFSIFRMKHNYQWIYASIKIDSVRGNSDRDSDRGAGFFPLLTIGSSSEV
jgi:hypothetical protein